MLIGEGSFLVEPGTGLVVWTIWSLFAVAAGLVTAAKGRWGWFLFGIVTGGLLWCVGAFLEPMPRSLWRKLRSA